MLAQLFVSQVERRDPGSAVAFGKAACLESDEVAVQCVLGFLGLDLDGGKLFSMSWCPREGSLPRLRDPLLDQVCAAEGIEQRANHRLVQVGCGQAVGRADLAAIAQPRLAGVVVIAGALAAC